MFEEEKRRVEWGFGLLLLKKSGRSHVMRDNGKSMLARSLRKIARTSWRPSRPDEDEDRDARGDDDLYKMIMVFLLVPESSKRGKTEECCYTTILDEEVGEPRTIHIGTQ
mmetsp:Transcript_68806/g.143697  ORF Transcript_68806/g.143697 Transcript_68806/m.143697 type:complete len:110 (-) Transcript_68806:95-424(-)